MQKEGVRLCGTPVLLPEVIGNDLVILSLSVKFGVVIIACLYFWGI